MRHYISREAHKINLCNVVNTELKESKQTRQTKHCRDKSVTSALQNDA